MRLTESWWKGSEMALLGLPRQIFIDANGAPLAGGWVTVYNYGTNTLATTYSDPPCTIANTNPIELDAAGSWPIYGQGLYRFSVTDAQNNPVASLNGTVAGAGVTIAYAGLGAVLPQIGVNGSPAMAGIPIGGMYLTGDFVCIRTV